MAKQPIAELFGFPVESNTVEAKRHRRLRLCPYNNKVPSCTKDSAIDPLGVCSVYHGNDIAMTCPVRLRQDWFTISDAADFFFDARTSWTCTTEVLIETLPRTISFKSPFVLVAFDEAGMVVNYGPLELISHELLTRGPIVFGKNGKHSYTLHPLHHPVIQQLAIKATLFRSWQRKMAIAIEQSIFNELPEMDNVAKSEADIAWLVYKLTYSEPHDRFYLSNSNVVYTRYSTSFPGMDSLVVGNETHLFQELQCRLDAC